MRLRRAVILTNGKAYAENQCIGLLDAINLNLDVSVKVVTSSPLTLRWWLQSLPCSLRVLLLRRAGLPLASRGICDEIVRAIKNEKEAGATLIVASGLEAITTAVQVKLELSKSVFVVILGNPQCDCSLFDLVISPAHELIGETEECPADNLIVTQGLLNRATYVALSRARAQSQAQLGGLMHPVLVVCFGGPTSLCPFDARMAAKEVRQVCKFAIEKGLVGHVVITYLNRTPATAKAEFSNLHWLDVWTGDFLPLLAWADIVAVTADSITSCNEVGSSGKPLFTIREDVCRGKVAAFFTYLEACGIAKPFTRDTMAKWASGWSYPALTTTMDAADRVAKELARANPKGTKMWYRR